MEARRAAIKTAKALESQDERLARIEEKLDLLLQALGVQARIEVVSEAGTEPGEEVPAAATPPATDEPDGAPAEGKPAPAETPTVEKETPPAEADPKDTLRPKAFSKKK